MLLIDPHAVVTSMPGANLDDLRTSERSHAENSDQLTFSQSLFDIRTHIGLRSLNCQHHMGWNRWGEG